MFILNILFFSVVNLIKPEAGTLHDFHVGITEIKYAEGLQTYQITIQLFTHDLEAAILKSTDTILQLGTRYEITNADSVIFHYFENKFSIKADGKMLELTKIGRETLSDDQTFIYLESLPMKPKDALLVKNILLMETFVNQTQIINVVQSGETHSATLSEKNQSDIISL